MHTLALEDFCVLIYPTLNSVPAARLVEGTQLGRAAPSACSLALGPMRSGWESQGGVELLTFRPPITEISRQGLRGKTLLLLKFPASFPTMQLLKGAQPPA